MSCKSAAIGSSRIKLPNIDTNEKANPSQVEEHCCKRRSIYGICSTCTMHSTQPDQPTHVPAIVLPLSWTMPANMFQPLTSFAIRLPSMCHRPNIYFRIDDALRSVAYHVSYRSNPTNKCRRDLLLNSLFFAFSSLTRLARIDAYSFCQYKSATNPNKNGANVDRCRSVSTYSSILGGFRLAALESHSVTLVLKTLGSDETLDTGCLGVRFLAFALWLNFTADDEFADLAVPNLSASIHASLKHQLPLVE